MVETALDQRVAALRGFNRFYTQRIGVLQEGLLSSPFSLTEARVLYELAGADQLTASQLGKSLELDAGYLSRILRGFERRGLICRDTSPNDRRVALLSLTAQGREAFAPLEARSQAQIGTLLRDLSDGEQARLVAAARTIERLLVARSGEPASFQLRPPRPGDMGWVTQRHGALYAQEYGWDMRFEALVAGIVAQFVKSFDPRRECCWIAEKDGENIGSVFLVAETETTAKLRLLLVEPGARGLGVGTRLVRECLRFSRQAGYAKVLLWTNSVLVAARRLYQREGFRRIKEEPHCSFGQELVGETWEMIL
ncbi:MAG TPA: bifunctional helix-turn-helix transcriptional regulator/GNAT family N-acetyltransferase [Stellaceae bacterium]|nr:bifunctional helix-turn-helix transcriptional regulator/GNAT family N-acetyltransferase [Stellaceae bacterium]